MQIRGGRNWSEGTKVEQERMKGGEVRRAEERNEEGRGKEREVDRD